MDDSSSFDRWVDYYLIRFRERQNSTTVVVEDNTGNLDSNGYLSQAGLISAFGNILSDDILEYIRRTHPTYEMEPWVYQLRRGPDHPTTNYTVSSSSSTTLGASSSSLVPVSVAEQQIVATLLVNTLQEVVLSSSSL